MYEKKNISHIMFLKQVMDYKLLSDDILEIFTDQNKLSSIYAQDKHIA